MSIARDIAPMMAASTVIGIAGAKYPGSLIYNTTPKSLITDAIGNPDCDGCGFKLDKLSPSDILMPGGKPIGTYRKDPRIRTVANESRLWRIINPLTFDAKPSTPNTPHNGQWFDLPSGGSFGVRTTSKSGGMTIDINIPGIPIDKIHLP